MISWRVLAGLWAALLLTVAGPARAGTPATVALHSCPLPDTEEMGRCGELVVPEDRARPFGRQIKLWIMVLPALDDEGRAPPLFDLAGGPGEAATESAAFYAVDGKAWRAHRDVVLVDIRGTGRSHPLRCPNLGPPSPLASLYPLDTVRECRRMLSEDTDLSQYTTRAAAEDMEAVRAALGYDSLDILALSYGTMLAQTYLRLYPGRVHAAVLVGSVPLGEPLPLHHPANAEPVLELLIADCAAQPACHMAYPDLNRDWRSLRAELADGSILMSGVSEMPVSISPGRLLEALRSLMTTSAGQALIPRVITQLAAGDVTGLIRKGAGGPPLAEGLYLSIACAEGTAWISDDMVEAAGAAGFPGRYRIDEQRTACREWGVPPVRGDALPPPPDIPILFIAGGRDQTTPPAWAERIAGDYPRSRVVIIPPMAHGIDGVEGIACFDNMAQAFLAAGTAEDLDTVCVATMRPPAFALPSQPSPGG